MNRFFAALDIAFLASIFSLYSTGGRMEEEMLIGSTGGVSTVCIGRYLIDFPKDMAVTQQPAYYRGWKLVRLDDQDAEAFEKSVQGRLNELQLGKNERGAVTLEKVVPIKAEKVTGSIFVYDRQWTRGSRMGQSIYYTHATVQAMVLVGNVQYEIIAAADLKDVDELLSVIGAMRYRRNDEIPQEAGFCFENAFIKDLGASPANESVMAFAGYESHPDLAIAFSTFTTKPDRTLLDRHNASQLPKQFPDRIKPLFIGPREINGIPGDEVSEKFYELKGTKSHVYMWEAHATQDDPMRANAILELTTGHGRAGEMLSSSLSDKEVQQLWAQISGSLRLRPVRVQEPVPAEQAKRPISTRVEAREACPASGWWTCADHEDGHGVLGGTTQYFDEGVRMPQASLLAPVTLMDKLKGQTPTFVLGTPTVWKLAREKDGT